MMLPLLPLLVLLVVLLGVSASAAPKLMAGGARALDSRPVSRFMRDLPQWMFFLEARSFEAFLDGNAKSSATTPRQFRDVRD